MWMLSALTDEITGQWKREWALSMLLSNWKYDVKSCGDCSRSCTDETYLRRRWKNRWRCCAEIYSNNTYVTLHTHLSSSTVCWFIRHFEFFWLLSDTSYYAVAMWCCVIKLYSWFYYDKKAEKTMTVSLYCSLWGAVSQCRSSCVSRDRVYCQPGQSLNIYLQSLLEWNVTAIFRSTSPSPPTITTSIYKFFLFSMKLVM